MLRPLIAGLFAAGMTAGCATKQPVLTGGYYCLEGTEFSCPSHERSGDCQPCPSAMAASAAAATAAVAHGRPD
jgi:hypothetical protein